jgi:RNA polymerase sigma factor (TIGR02999 family)
LARIRLAAPDRRWRSVKASSNNVTQLLLDWSNGDKAALDHLIEAVYGELRRLAVRYLSHERSDHTLQPTALVHEAYLQLVDQKRVNWQNRAHFFGAAARLMRRILVDHARSHQAAKRGGGYRITLSDAVAVAQPPDFDLIALDDALDELSSFDQQQSRVVELRYFGGLSIEETAAVLQVSPATVKRDWTTAKAWLRRRITKDPEP